MHDEVHVPDVQPLLGDARGHQHVVTALAQSLHHLCSSQKTHRKESVNQEGIALRQESSQPAICSHAWLDDPCIGVGVWVVGLTSRCSFCVCPLCPVALDVACPIKADARTHFAQVPRSKPHRIV